MTSWSPYPEYKPSSVEWLGEIPESWRVMRLRYACEVNPSKAEIWDLPPDTEVSFVPMELIGEDGSYDLRESRTLGEVVQGYTYFRTGDVVVAKITPCFENGKGALLEGLRAGIGFGTTELHVLRAREDADPRFIFYVTRSSAFRQLGTATMYGAAGQQRVPSDFVENLPTPIPPLPEQRAIAAFLDRQTERIDTLIALKERQIALLQEKRAALISHAVTKGLDPDVPMKDSGIEWLGEIPAHWRVPRLKFIASVQSGVAKGRNLEPTQTITVPYLRVANVQNGYVDLTDVADIEILASELSRYSLRQGDILMTEGGDFDKLGRGTVWEDQIAPCIHQNHVFVIRAGPGQNPYWISKVTEAEYARHFFIIRSKQSTNLASISSTNLLDLPVVLPPLNEQERILDRLTSYTDALDRAISEVQRSTALLDEYRTALISAAVTGKIDVREEVSGCTDRT